MNRTTPTDEAIASRYGNRFITEGAPAGRFPEVGMAAQDAMRLAGQELILDGDPQRNLATFVTTWMEPEAQRIIAANLHRNFIDHAEYPQTAEIEQRCIRMHIDAAGGGFVWPFLHPESVWVFRLQQVRSINVSGHKFGLVYPGIGWLVFRERGDLSEDLVFYENYLGKTDATFTLNFSTGSAMVLAQYYNLVRLGREGYTYVMEMMQQNARALAERLRSSGDFELIGEHEEQLPLVAFKLAEQRHFDEFDIAWQLSAERGWMVPAYTLPPDAQHVKLMRALVKETLSRELVDALADDVAQACRTLEQKGGAHESERRRVKTGVGSEAPGAVLLAQPPHAGPPRCRDARALRGWSPAAGRPSPDERDE